MGFYNNFIYLLSRIILRRVVFYIDSFNRLGQGYTRGEYLHIAEISPHLLKTVEDHGDFHADLEICGDFHAISDFSENYHANLTTSLEKIPLLKSYSSNLNAFQPKVT